MAGRNAVAGEIMEAERMGAVRLGVERRHIPAGLSRHVENSSHVIVFGERMPGLARSVL